MGIDELPPGTWTEKVPRRHPRPDQTWNPGAPHPGERGGGSDTPAEPCTLIRMNAAGLRCSRSDVRPNSHERQRAGCPLHRRLDRQRKFRPRRKREFGDSQVAIKYAQGLIDGVLNLHFGGAKSAHELMTHYTISGSEVPKIYGEPGADFHAYRYAREKAEAMFALSANGLAG